MFPSTINISNQSTSKEELIVSSLDRILEKEKRESPPRGMFKHKLSGAVARLFARACLDYFDGVEEGFHDRPSKVPAFRYLSPHQRVHLVRELAIGLLCEGELLPQKEIYLVAYYAVIASIKSRVQLGIDYQFEVEIDESILNEIHDCNSTDDNERRSECTMLESKLSRINHIFNGGPVSKESRRYLKPTPDEKDFH